MEQMQKALIANPRLNLRALIIKAGFTNAEAFCKESGLDRSTVSLVLSGRLIPGAKFIERTARACKKTKKEIVEALY
jgi:transcriptional regulator with XRE-family HTH domain